MTRLPTDKRKAKPWDVQSVNVNVNVIAQLGGMCRCGRRGMCVIVDCCESYQIMGNRGIQVHYLIAVQCGESALH